MTTKNSILLIVKQNNGIDYNELLNKFSGSYSNTNSARAALSRSLKDLSIFGFIAKRGNRFYLLEKGEQEMYSEIKNKLVLSLNSSLKQKHPENDIDSIVTKLQVLIERSREDRGLLKTSKSSLDFSLTDFGNVGTTLEKKVKHLNYISKVFKEQINSLKELDFNDSDSRPLDSESILLLEKIFSKFNEKEFTIETQNPVILGKLSKKLNSKPKESSFQIPKKSLKNLCEFVKKNSEEFSLHVITVYSSSLKAQFFKNKIFLFGPFSEIKKWKQT